ncbi:MAG: fatty acid desaturase family protein [Pacificimonas sp.]
MAKTVSVSDFLSGEDVRRLQRRSNLRASVMVAWTWALIAGAFALAIVYPNPLTILLAVLILGGRQLALGIIVHDCAHNAMFTTRRMNELVGHWLAGAPMNIPLAVYRDYHLKHHRYAGTPDDPDIVFVHKYPISRASLKRKFMRDLTGRTGVRDTLGKLKSFKLAKNYPWLLFHVGLLAVLAAVGAPWAYGLWWAAELFAYPAIVRLRQIGEHGVAPNRTSLDPRDNTSTTLAPWWQRLFVAPNHVHYHLEHHLMSGVPPYRLRDAHRLLAARGFHDDHACVANGYGDVLRRAVRADGSGDAMAV